MTSTERSSLAGVLVGIWVLLQPPLQDGKVLSGAPLGDWVVNGQFADQKQCEDTRASSEALLIAGVTQGQGVVSSTKLSKRELLLGLAGPAGAVILDSQCIELDELKRRLGTKPSDADAVD